MSAVYGGIREEGAIVGDRKGSRYVLGVTGGWRAHGARKGGESRSACEMTVFVGLTWRLYYVEVNIEVTMFAGPHMEVSLQLSMEFRMCGRVAVRSHLTV